MKVLILAGGSGTRLWPLSRDRYPKQFIKLMNSDTSLFQETFKRSLKLANIDDIYVITNVNYKFLVMGEVDELGYSYKESNILVEPEAKNTLPAIFYGVDKINKEGNTDTVVVFPSDHIITKSDDFVDIIKSSDELSKENIITFGIMPTEPNTGYGYISPGDTILNGNKVLEFKEKPNLDTAVEYLKKGYLWNGGIFMFNSSVFTDEVKKYQPQIYKAFSDNEGIEAIFAAINKGISIDYGIMEQSDKVAVVKVDIGWNDLGSFDAFFDVFPRDEHHNISDDDNIFIEAKNNLVYTESDKIVATVGLEDLIVVDKKDALLICKKDQSQKVKDIVGELQKRNDVRTKYHLEDYRPWGKYNILEEVKSTYKIKKITVNPGKKLSYQYHFHRSEHWIVVRGMAKVTIDDVEQFVRAGESIFMKAGQKHRLENPGKVLLEIIEVQMGDYLEEDDIVRIDDDFNRC